MKYEVQSLTVFFQSMHLYVLAADSDLITERKSGLLELS